MHTMWIELPQLELAVDYSVKSCCMRFLLFTVHQLIVESVSIWLFFKKVWMQFALYVIQHSVLAESHFLSCPGFELIKGQLVIPKFEVEILAGMRQKCLI